MKTLARILTVCPNKPGSKEEICTQLQVAGLMRSFRRSPVINSIFLVKLKVRLLAESDDDEVTLDICGKRRKNETAF